MCDGGLASACGWELKNIACFLVVCHIQSDQGFAHFFDKRLPLLLWADYEATLLLVCVAGGSCKFFYLWVKPAMGQLALFVEKQGYN
jgi:hypothetical protein